MVNEIITSDQEASFFSELLDKRILSHEITFECRSVSQVKHFNVFFELPSFDERERVVPSPSLLPSPSIVN